MLVVSLKGGSVLCQVATSITSWLGYTYEDRNKATAYLHCSFDQIVDWFIYCRHITCLENSVNLYLYGFNLSYLHFYRSLYTQPVKMSWIIFLYHAGKGLGFKWVKSISMKNTKVYKRTSIQHAVCQMCVCVCVCVLCVCMTYV